MHILIVMGQLICLSHNSGSRPNDDNSKLSENEQKNMHK